VRRRDCLPPGAIVVQVGRAALLGGGALAEPVPGGQIPGAVFDVFLEELAVQHTGAPPRNVVDKDAGY